MNTARKRLADYRAPFSVNRRRLTDPSIRRCSSLLGSYVEPEAANVVRAERAADIRWFGHLGFSMHVVPFLFIDHAWFSYRYADIPMSACS